MRYSVILSSPHAWFFFLGGGRVRLTKLYCYVSLIMVTLNSAVLKSKFSFIHVGGRN